MENRLFTVPVRSGGYGHRPAPGSAASSIEYSSPISGSASKKPRRAGAQHGAGMIPIFASGQRAQQTAADLGMDFVEQLLVGGTAFMKGRGSRGVSLENALDDEAVEVLMRIEQRAKAVDEGHRADPGIGAQPGRRGARLVPRRSEKCAAPAFRSPDRVRGDHAAASGPTAPTGGPAVAGKRGRPDGRRFRPFAG
jgi:hypothetical protein